MARKPECQECGAECVGAWLEVKAHTEYTFKTNGYFCKPSCMVAFFMDRENPTREKVLQARKTKQQEDMHE